MENELIEIGGGFAAKWKYYNDKRNAFSAIAKSAVLQLESVRVQ